MLYNAQIHSCHFPGGSQYILVGGKVYFLNTKAAENLIKHSIKSPATTSYPTLYMPFLLRIPNLSLLNFSLLAFF
jgi:hypothetical protein